MFNKTLWVLDKAIVLLVLVIVIAGDVPQLTENTDRVRVYTRAIEFDYPSWVWSATWNKIEQSVIGAPFIFQRGTKKQIVLDYLRTTNELEQTNLHIEQIFADPSVTDKETTSAHLRTQRDALLKRQVALAPFAESILQGQLSEALADLNLTTEGQPLPPVLYRSSSTPLALIVSPRDHVEQIANISILPSLTLDEQIKLEDTTANSLNVSTLIVPIGGIGVYPTMVMETTDLRWLLEVIAHEWTHNYLELRPLGINYSTTPELRTMNETTASISGNEVGAYVLKKFYPEIVVSLPSAGLISFQKSSLPSSGFADTPPFDFRAEMHETRVKADELLAQGKTKEAEDYMEARRQVFWKNGYLIRKLNQAYFAFYGAYADVPGGAAGEDPVGPAVRALRAQSNSLADFINTIGQMTSFEQLQKAIKK